MDDVLNIFNVSYLIVDIILLAIDSAINIFSVRIQFKRHKKE